MLSKKLLLLLGVSSVVGVVFVYRCLRATRKGMSGPDSLRKKYRSDYADAPPGPQQLSVVTWNVLAHCYTRTGWYTYAPKELLETATKQTLVLDLLFRRPGLSAQVICLQEMDWHEDFQAEAEKRGFKCHYAKRTADKKDGCLVAWDSKELELVEAKVVELNRIVEDPERAMKLWILNPDLQSVQQRFKRENVVQYVVLKHLKTGKIVIVGNTHLYYHPAHDDVRLRQVMECIKGLEALSKEYTPAGIIFAGDLNSSPDSDVYKCITTGKVAVESLQFGKGADSKLLLEGDLNKVVKWLRNLGVDAEYMRTESKSEYDTVYKRAKDEDRIVVSKNKKLVQRADCPLHVLIPFHLSHEATLRFVCQVFGYDRYPSRFFTRCVGCNIPLTPLTLEEACLHSQMIDSLREGKDGGVEVQFYNCPKCQKLLWWGPSSYFTVSDLQRILNPDGDSDSKELEVTSAPGTKFQYAKRLFRSSDEGEFVVHNLHFKSSLAQLFGTEPEFTNYTATFKGTLDYIFYDYSKGLKLDSVLELPSEKELQVHIACPNLDWPSDHLPLKAEFSFISEETKE